MGSSRLLYIAIRYQQAPLYCKGETSGQASKGGRNLQEKSPDPCDGCREN